MGGRAGGGARGVALTLVLAVTCSGCAALDSALADPGDTELVAEASLRALAPASEPLDLDRRAVDVRLTFPDDGSAPVVLTSGAGFCGWSGEGSWRATLGEGPEWVSSDEEGRTWAGVLLTGSVDDGDPLAHGEEPVVVDAVLEASYSSYEEGGSVVVSQEGRLEVEPSGLRAVFTAPPVPGPADGEEPHPLAGTEVVVVCSAAADTDV